MLYSFLPFQIVTSKYSDKALTTEEPTPWSPPDILYPEFSPPNFPPAWRTVNTVSTADFFVLGWISTGIPLPLSSTTTELSAFNVTCIFEAWPAKCSSIELSTISLTRWWRPFEFVSPIYIPGLFLTASKFSTTSIADASYCLAIIYFNPFNFFVNIHSLLSVYKRPILFLIWEMSLKAQFKFSIYAFGIGYL